MTTKTKTKTKNVDTALSILLGVLLTIPALSFAAKVDTSMTAEQWRSITERDIEAAYSISAKNHPGMFDVNNPTFPDLLNQAPTILVKAMLSANVMDKALKP